MGIRRVLGLRWMDWLPSPQATEPCDSGTRPIYDTIAFIRASPFGPLHPTTADLNLIYSIPRIVYSGSPLPRMRSSQLLASPRLTVGPVRCVTYSQYCAGNIAIPGRPPFIEEWRSVLQVVVPYSRGSGASTVTCIHRYDTFALKSCFSVAGAHPILGPIFVFSDTTLFCFRCSAF